MSRQTIKAIESDNQKWIREMREQGRETPIPTNREGEVLGLATGGLAGPSAIRASAAALFRRTPEAALQIDAARAEPTRDEVVREMDQEQRELEERIEAANDPRLGTAPPTPPNWAAMWRERVGVDMGSEPSRTAVVFGFIADHRAWFVSCVNAVIDGPLVLDGAELAAYRALKAAAAAALEAQQAHVAAGAGLRTAIQGLCAEIAQGKAAA